MEVPANGDYYLDLGLIENATAEQIRKAFRKLSLATHPDKHPGKEEEFQPKFVKINLAYEILGNAERRAEYDSSYQNIKKQWAEHRKWKKQQEKTARQREDMMRIRENSRRSKEDARREREDRVRKIENARREAEDARRDKENSRRAEEDAAHVEERSQQAKQERAAAERREQEQEEARFEEERKYQERQEAIRKEQAQQERKRREKEAARRSAAAAEKRRQDNIRRALERARQAKQDEADQRCRKHMEDRQREEAQRALLVKQTWDEQERLSSSATSKWSRMSIDEQAAWIKQEARSCIHPFAEQSRQVGAMPNLARKKFKDWLGRSERLMGFLEQLVIQPQLRADVAQVHDILQTVLGEEDGKAHAHFPQPLRDRARTLLGKWEAIAWGARRCR